MVELETREQAQEYLAQIHPLARSIGKSDS
jgi:hypothetical protein